MVNPIQYLERHGFKVSSDPNEYYYDYNTKTKKKPWGQRDYTQNGINHDAYCGGKHPAYDLYKAHGSPLPAVVSGTIVSGTSSKGNFGGTVVLADHKGDYQYIYGHCDDLLVSVGDIVEQGDTVAYQSNTNYYNNKMDSHLHLQVQKQGYLADEKAFVCTGINPLNIDVNQYKKKGSNTVVKTHLIVAGHGGVDPGAIGNGTNERDFIRNHIVDRVAKYINATPGHKAVVYNKKNNMFVDTQYGTGYGMYWAKAQGYDTVTEYHLDAASASARGGHVIVYSGYAPDKIDLGIRDAIQKYVGVRYTHKGHSGISGRNNLLQVNVAADIGVNYRLVELGFITNKADFQAINNNIEALTRDMANAITGGTSSAQAVKKPKAKPKTNVTTNKKDASTKTPRTIGSWKTNSHGTQYIQAEGTFTVTANDGIVSRFGSPFLSSPHGGLAKKGWSHKYSSLLRQDGHVWIEYMVDGKLKYLPYNTWNSKTGAVGSVSWGTFS